MGHSGRLLAILFAVFMHAVEAGADVPVAVDLASLAKDIQSRRAPLLVIFSARDCEFCERLEQDHLLPMMSSGEYRDKVIIRKFMVDGISSVRDFAGHDVAPEAFADLYSVDVTPTLMVFDHRGRMLARKIVGYNGSEFFGVYLDNMIDTARYKLPSF